LIVTADLLLLTKAARIEIRRKNADNQSTGSQGQDQNTKENKYTGAGRFTATPWCLCPGLYNNPQEA
jgi:hypothetical protein